MTMSGQGFGGEGAREREPRHRLSPGQEKMVEQYLATKGPRKCALESSDCSGRLTHDHIDGDRNNNAITNFRWLCIGHQNKERARLAKVGRAVESAKQNENVRMSESMELLGESSAEIKTSSEWRPKWQAKLVGLILQHGKVTVLVATAGLAQWIRTMTKNTKGSEVTCRRWLRETTTDPNAIFELFDDPVSGPCVRLARDKVADLRKEVLTN
jgi:hypothetical protein